jgi:hypothetical protein
MSFREHRLIDMIRCDVTGCTSVIRLPEPLPYFEARDALEAAAVDAGWLHYSGANATRDYCRVHAPRPGHRMRLVWGEPR